MSKVVFVHYHLRSGGVGSVIRRQATAMAGLGHAVVIASGDADTTRVDGIERACLPGLGYRDHPMPPAEIEALATALEQLSAGGVLHFHNPTIGKNPSWPDLITILAARGQPMVLQVHDFYEDGRASLAIGMPDRSRWYPRGSHVRWLTINESAARVLQLAGIAKDMVCAIPNPVIAMPLPDGPVDPGLILYPTRGLKRKNPGECVLLAVLLPTGHRIATTLAPEDPRQARGHARWQIFARRAGLPVSFAIGWPAIRPARCLSTSIQEGFGLALAEPWLNGIPVSGRWLDDATSTLVEKGWDRGDAYAAITVPSSWIPRTTLRAAVDRACNGIDVESIMACHFNGPTIDFGRLPVFLQRLVIRLVVRDSRAKSSIRMILPDGRELDPPAWIAGWHANTDAAMATNRHILQTHCHPDAIASMLAGHYKSVLDARPSLHGHADASMVWKAFHTPERFHFLRLPP